MSSPAELGIFTQELNTSNADICALEQENLWLCAAFYLLGIHGGPEPVPHDLPLCRRLQGSLISSHTDLISPLFWKQTTYRVTSAPRVLSLLSTARHNQRGRELPGLLRWPLPSSILSSSAHLQRQRTRWSQTLPFWLYQSLVLPFCLSGFQVLRENSYYVMRPPEKHPEKQALPGTSLISIHLGFLSVAPVTVKSLGGCLLLSCDWNLKRDLQQELNKSKIWMPDLPEHGVGRRWSPLKPLWHGAICYTG